MVDDPTGLAVIPVATPVGGVAAGGVGAAASEGRATTNDGAELPTVPARSPVRRRS